MNNLVLFKYHSFLNPKISNFNFNIDSNYPIYLYVLEYGDYGYNDLNNMLNKYNIIYLRIFTKFTISLPPCINKVKFIVIDKSISVISNITKIRKIHTYNNFKIYYDRLHGTRFKEFDKSFLYKTFDFIVCRDSQLTITDTGPLFKIWVLPKCIKLTISTSFDKIPNFSIYAPLCNEIYTYTNMPNMIVFNDTYFVKNDSKKCFTKLFKVAMMDVSNKNDDDEIPLDISESNIIPVDIWNVRLQDFYKIIGYKYINTSQTSQTSQTSKDVQNVNTLQTSEKLNEYDFKSLISKDMFDRYFTYHRIITYFDYIEFNKDSDLLPINYKLSCPYPNNTIHELKENKLLKSHRHIYNAIKQVENKTSYHFNADLIPADITDIDHFRIIEYKINNKYQKYSMLRDFLFAKSELLKGFVKSDGYAEVLKFYENDLFRMFKTSKLFDKLLNDYNNYLKYIVLYMNGIERNPDDEDLINFRCNIGFLCLDDMMYILYN